MKKSIKLNIILILGLLFVFAFVTFANTDKTVKAEETTYTAETLVDGTFEMIDGVSLKLNENGGIRFKVKMSDSVNTFIAGEDVELGFIIAPKSLLANTTDYLSMTQKIKITADKTKIYADGDFYIANGCVVSVLEQNRKLDYSAIAYILQGDKVQYTTLNDNSRGNLYNVAKQAVLADYDSDVFGLSSYNAWFGTKDYPIDITSLDEYNALITKINNGATSFKDKYVSLSDDYAGKDGAVAISEDKKENTVLIMPILSGDFEDLSSHISKDVTIPVASVYTGTTLQTTLKSPSGADATITDGKFTATEVGTYVITYTATSNGGSISETVNVVVADHTSDGKTYYNEAHDKQYSVCSVCSANYGETTHTHTAGADYQYNETNHWKLCACGEKMDETAHTLTVGSDANSSHWFKCDTCGFSDEANKADKNVIASFDSAVGINSVSPYDVWGTSIDNTMKCGNDKGSLKVTVNETQNFSYMILSMPLMSDVSAYDYIAFNVYNPTSKTLQIQPAWGNTTTIGANSWTQVVAFVSQFTGGVFTSMSETVLSADNITNLSLCIYDSDWSVGDCFYISSICAYKNEEAVAENVIASFASDIDANRTQTYWSAEGNVSLDTDIKYGNEKGSLKYTFTPTVASYNYVVITAPNIIDVSTYDYIEFNVYNPTVNAITIQPAWRNGTTIAANGWTTVKLNISAFASGAIVNPWNSTAISSKNITKLAFCIYNGAMTSGDSIYFSSFVAYNTESENIVQSFDSSADLSTVCSFAGKHTLSIDSTTVHGEDKGSLKVSFNNTDATPGNTYVVLQAPIKSDVSEYDYISFWVYCDKACHIDILPATANVVEANTWTEIKITKDQLNTSQGFDGSWNSINISASDISQMSFYFTWCDDYRAGDSIYISSITCGKNA